jgi:hypothetical protein
MRTSKLKLNTGMLLACLLAANTWFVHAAADPKGKHSEGATPVKFAVISDPHLYNARLGTSGSAFQTYLYGDPKLLKESEAILESALESIEQQGVQFLLISGDLTKDGELADHVLMAQHLAKLEQHGIQAYVVPGNHDVNNPEAFTYLGDTTRPVPNVSPNVFRALYQRFGYGQAIERDANSLSYLAEPAPGLWLLAIDSCKYQDNLELGTPVVSGRISPETMTWILAKLQEAQAAGKQVIAMMHHGVNLHFAGEDQVFPDYLVDDWQDVSTQLAGAGLQVIFTGHYHSQDAAYPVDAHYQPIFTLCDVETGSLVQYPCAYRIVTIDGKLLDIKSQRVTSIDAGTKCMPFQTYAEQTLRGLLPVQVEAELTALFPGITPEQVAGVTPLVVDALVANYAGDESPSDTTKAILNGLVHSPEPAHTLGLMLGGLWTDLWPPDNNLTIPFSQFSVGRTGTQIR